MVNELTLTNLDTVLRRGRGQSRPIRIAFLVQDGDKAQLALDGIFADCYRRWGGRFSLVVPCVGHAIPSAYWPWLTTYDPDIVYSYFDMSKDGVLEVHERLGPSVFEVHRDLGREDVHGYTPRYGAEPLQSLSIIFRRSRWQERGSAHGPLRLIDAWFTESETRFLTDNFGTYHSSYGTGVFPPDARASADLLTIVSAEKQADRRFGVPQNLNVVSSELEAFQEFAHRRASSLSIASMDFAPKLDVSHTGWSDSFSLVIGGSYADRILFWNSRLLLPNWIGSDLGAFRVDADQLADENYFSTLVALINQRNYVNHGSGGQYALTIRSTSIGEDQLTELVARLRAAKCWSVARAEAISDLSIMVPTSKDLEHASLLTLGTPFIRRTRPNEFTWTGRLAAPAISPPDHLEDAPHRQHFASGFWASDYLLDSSEPKPRFSNSNVWLLPRRWRMAGAFETEYTSVSQDLVYPPRSSRSGELTLFESLERRVRTISVPSGVEAIRYALLQDGRWGRMDGYKGTLLPMSTVDWMAPSNEAKYLNGVVGMAGGLGYAATFLLHPFLRNMFADLGGTPGLPLDKVQPTVARLRNRSGNLAPYDLRDEHERLSLGTLIVKASQDLKSPRDFLRHAALADRWRQHREAYWNRVGRPQNADSSVDWDQLEQASLDQCLIAMRQRQMIFQGHEWVCPTCHHRNWVDLSELRPLLRCKICRHEMEAPITFDWLFRPSDFMIESLRDHSTLSLVWTLKAMRNEARNAFFYSGPTWLWYDDRDRGPDAEVDLLMVCDQSAIVAEVKSSWAGVRASDIDALGDAAEHLKPDIALLAVMDTGRQHVDRLEKLKTRLKASGIELSILTLDTNPLEDEPHLW